MNIVFLGTPEIARVCLEEILKTKHKVLAVITNPDRASGRGNHLTESPVKTFAKAQNLKVLQYQSVSKEAVAHIKALKPDALVLVAFGQILSQEILDIALPINLHGSLLPQLRGPSPIQTAILNGLTQTGVSIMRMERGVDNGDVLLQKHIPICPEDTAGTLFDKMAKVGAKALVEALNQIENKTDVWTKQNHNNASFCQMLTKENAKLDFDQSKTQIVNKVRAYNPNPVAFFILGNDKIKVFEAKVVDGNFDRIGTGKVAVANPKQGLIIEAKDGFVEILKLQAPNSKIMDAKQFLNGKKIEVGTSVL